MRLLTYRFDDELRTGVASGDDVIDLGPGDVGQLLRDPDWRERAAHADGTARPLAELSLAPVVSSPSKIICLGLNYKSHIEEMGRPLPDDPTLFTKFASSLVGARDPIELSPLSSEPDWEAELAFVIGQPLRHASRDAAEAAIAGYTIMNDVSMRDWQWRSTQWLAGKTWERSTPLGPMLVTPEEIDHARDLELRCEVDGVVMQRARTSDLLFDPAHVASYISTFTTLEPGDVISTGTPGGVGTARTPAVSLLPGQVLRTAIDGLGECVNQCVIAAPAL